MHIPFVRIDKFKFLAQFPVDHLPHPVVSSLVLVFVLVCRIRLLCDSWFRPNYHMTYTCNSVASILFLFVSLVFMALFCAAIRRDLVSLLKFPFHRHFLVFSCEISSVCRSKYPYSRFSFHFGFLIIIVLLIFMLSVLFLIAVIILSLLYLM